LPDGLAVLGDTLFVASDSAFAGESTVGEYDAKTGAVINANFITGLTDVTAIAVKSAK
jgi:hypothetical protein